MPGSVSSASTVDAIGDLKSRIAELEQECARLRSLSGDAAICRSALGSSEAPPGPEARPLALLDALPLPTCYVDADLCCRFANRAFRARFGKANGATRSNGLDDLLGKVLFRRLRAPIDKALSGQEVSVVVAAPSHDVAQCEMTFVPDRASGNGIGGFLVTACDVTDERRTAQALQRTQTLFERTERVAGLGYSEWHADTGRCLSCSSGLKQLLGLHDESRMTAQGYLNAIHPEDRRRYRSATKRHRGAGQRYEIEYRIVKRDGEIADLREVGEPIPSPNGGAGHWLTCVQDVTAQRERDRDLRWSEGKYRDLTLGSIEGISIVRDQKVLFANQALADMFGFDTPEQLLALEHTDAIIPPHERARIRGYRDARLRGEPAPTRYVAQYLRRDGTPIWVESVIRVVDWVGGPAVQATLLDITARIGAEAALKASERRFRDFAEASSDWFWEMGPDLNFTWFSQEILQGTNIRSRDLIGKSREECGIVAEGETEWQGHHAGLRARRPFRGLRSRMRNDGQDFYASVSGVPVFAEDGTFLGYRGTATNITAQIRAEQEAARAHALLVDAIESVSEGFAMFDRQDRLVLCNEGFRERVKPILHTLEPNYHWRDMMRAMVEHGLLEAPADDLDGWIREQLEAHHTVGTARQIEVGNGHWVEIRQYPTRDGGFATVKADISALKRAEQAVKESEQRFKDFAEASTDWFWEMGPDLRFSWFSHEVLKGTGIRANDLIGKNRREAGRTDTDAEKWRDHLADLAARRPFKNFRYLARNQRDEDIYVSVSGLPLFDAEGTFLGYRGTATNITAQVRAEQEAARANGLLRDAIESINDAFVLYDRDDRLVMVNAYARNSAPQLEDVLKPGATWEDLTLALLDRGVLKVAAEQRDAWMREQREAHRQGGGVRYHELTDGRWLELHDHRTRDGGCAVVGTNVTELKRAERALQESKQRFQDFAEASSDWFWEMGPDLRFTWFSNGDSVAIGKTRAENSGAAVDTPEWRDHLAALEARRPFKDFRYMGHDQHGAEIHASVSGVPIFDADGAFLGYRGSATDITSEVGAEQRAARAQAMLVDAIESVGDGFLLYDREDRLVLVNENCRNSLPEIADLLQPGAPREQLLRAQLERGLLKVPAEQQETWLREQLDVGRRRGAVRYQQSSDGRWLELRDHRTRDGGCATVRTDVTELKRAEAALKESERRFKDFAEASSDWFWEMGPDLCFSWFSHQLPGNTGRSAAELIGKPRRLSGDSDADQRTRRAHLADLKARSPFKDFRYCVVDAHGREQYLSVSGVPVFDDDNRFLGYRGTGKNVTAEVLAEQRAIQAQSTLNDAVESIEGGFALFDRCDRLVLCNENYRKSLAAIAHLIEPGASWETLFRCLIEYGDLKISGEDREAWIQEHISLHRRPGSTRYYETQDGRWLEVREYPTRDGGIAIIRADITALKQAETALRESETLLKQATQMANLGHWVWDERLDRCVYCSEELARISRVTVDEYLSIFHTMDARLASIHPDDRDRYHRIIEEAKRNAQPYQVEFRDQSPTGECRYLRERGEPFLDEAERHVRTLGILQDITEYKQIESALKESESLLKHAAQIADLGHWVWDEQADRCIHCSEGLARMYGMTPEEYIAKLGTHPLTIQTMLDEDKERYDEVICRAIRLKKGYDIEFRERLADGSIRHMRERGEPVLNEADLLVRTVGILQDITKHKRAEEAIRHARDELEMRVEERTAALRTANRALRRAIVKHERTEEALRESRGLLEAIIEAAAMGINVKAPDLRYVFMNRYQASVYGVLPEQAVGKTPGELVNPQYGDYIAAHDRRVLETGATMAYFEEEIRDKDDVLRTWLTTKVPVRDNHGVLRYIVSASLDVSELKARERELKQAQKMDAVGKLTGGIAHDFNNLLFVIRGNVALLKDEIGESGSARECLGAIQDAAKLGADLTRSLLAFSRQQPLEPAVVDLPEIVAHTVATLLRPLEKNIEIETSYAEHVWSVMIDRQQLENALLNLALNARDAMPNGGHLRISVENRHVINGRAKHGYFLPPGDYVRLVVADTGVGMPPDVIEHAFDPFFTTKPTGSGTGLGLSMVYGFIKQSGGFIDIESKPGKGTMITMHLPSTADVEEKPAPTCDEQRWVARGNETILVTEDDAAVRRVAVRILAKLGYHTREASNGAEALEILRREPAIDLLFADIVLSGGLNGAQLAHEAQARRPDLKLLFASGYSQPAVLRDAKGADAVPLLSKPYDAEELGKLIRRLLDGGAERDSG